MKRDNKQRLIEVMGRLDKTFKPKLNEGMEDLKMNPAEFKSSDTPPIEDDALLGEVDIMSSETPSIEDNGLFE